MPKEEVPPGEGCDDGKYYPGWGVGKFRSGHLNLPRHT